MCGFSRLVKPLWDFISLFFGKDSPAKTSAEPSAPSPPAEVAAAEAAGQAAAAGTPPATQVSEGEDEDIIGAEVPHQKKT